MAAFLSVFFFAAACAGFSAVIDATLFKLSADAFTGSAFDDDDDDDNNDDDNDDVLELLDGGLEVFTINLSILCSMFCLFTWRQDAR